MKPTKIFMAVSLLLAAVPQRALAQGFLDAAQTPLVRAVREGSADEVSRLLSSEPIGDLDKCHGGTSLASYASERGELAMLESLVRAGVSADGRDCEGDSPLYYAAEQGHADVVRYLLTRKPDVGFRVGNGSTPLLAAIEGPLFEKGAEPDRPRTIRLLLEAGSDPDAENRYGQTPLLLAVRQADARLARLLLSHKADPARKNKEGLSALDLAKQEGLEYLAKVLEGTAPPLPGPEGLKLIEAAKAGDVRTIGKLLASGVPADAPDESGSTALIHAAATGKEEAALALIAGNASVNARDQLNATPLIYASGTGSLKLMQSLLDWGAFPRAKDHFGHSPLSYAVWGGHAEAVRLLLSRGADPDERFGNGRTFLMEAAAKGDAPVVRALAQGKATVDAPDKDGRTALMLAAKEGRPEAVAALLEAGASPQAADSDGLTPLRHALESGHPEIARTLLDKGAKAEPAALWSAVRNDNVEFVALLLGKGVDPNAREASLPLVAAARAYSDKAALVKLLLDAGARVDAADEDGRTALMEASQWHSSDSLKAVELLLARGADAKLKDAKGLSAWTHAMLTGNNAAARLLEKAGAPADCESLGWEGIFHKDARRAAEVLADQRSFEAAWRRAGKDEEAPLIDFGACVAAFVSLGTIHGPETASIRFKPAVVDGALALDYSLGRHVIYDVSETSPYALRVFRLSGAKTASIKPPPEFRRDAFEDLDLQPPPGSDYKE